MDKMALIQISPGNIPQSLGSHILKNLGIGNKFFCLKITLQNRGVRGWLLLGKNKLAWKNRELQRRININYVCSYIAQVKLQN